MTGAEAARTTTTEAAGGVEEAEAELRWEVHLAREQPGRAALVVIAAVLSGALCWYLFHNWLFALLTPACLIGGTAEFLFPIRYRLSPDGAEMRNLHTWRRIAWADVKRVYVAEDAIKLSPLAHGGPREAYRGVLLRCAENRDAVLDTVRRSRDAGPGA